MDARVARWGKALAFTLALVGSGAWGFGSTGCLLPDRCIVVYSYGDNWCMDAVGAQMWPPDAPEFARDIQTEEGLLPRGCRCFNDAEGQTLQDGLVNPKYEDFLAEIEEVTRNECALLVPQGWDHNCYDEDDEGPAFIQPFIDGKGDCVGDCTLTCDDFPDPDPYECEGLVNGDGETGDDETSDDSGTGAADTGGPSFSPGFQGDVVWPR